MIGNSCGGAGGGGGGGASSLNVDKFTATPGQTVFTLAAAPDDVAKVFMFVNGILYDDGVDYIVVGVTVTWQNVDFAMQGGERVQVIS